MEIEQQIHEICWELEKEGCELTAKYIAHIYKHGRKQMEPRLLDFFQSYIAELNAKKEHSPSVLNHYRQAYDKLSAYLKKNKQEDMLLKDFSRRDIDGFEVFMLSTPSPAIGKPISRNSSNNRLKKLKAVINNALLKELITRNPFIGFKLRAVESHREALNQQEIEVLRNYEFVNESLSKCKDILVWSIFTGMRYSDVFKLRETDIVEDESGRLYITGFQKKTGYGIEIPMMTQAKELYDKYEPYRLLTGYVMPRISNAKCNAYLKEVGKIAGIHKPLSTHIGRHIFATMMVEHSVDLKVVSKLLGHRSIKTSELYGKITRKNLSSVAQKMEKELG